MVGERRWRAARDAGLSHVDCITRHDIEEQKAREMQFAENYQREDVPPLEQARDAGEDVELEGWLWFFSLIERRLGSARFERFLAKYKNRRTGRRIDSSPIFGTSHDIGSPRPTSVLKEGGRT